MLLWHVHQAAFGGDKMLDMAHEDEDVLLNTGYYHRFFKYDTEGAMGIKVSEHTAFSTDSDMIMIY